jgi:hypothetical protein|tara:strand:+ start:2976 stop:3464 length:489 start_codon:yes stop_codon:yes gene_type:complete
MTKDDIIRVCGNTQNLLIKKNKAYGDSALEPIGIFGNGDAVTSLGARMDDKLMRLKSLGIGKDSIDTLYDLHGYITLLIIAIERKESIDSFDAVCKDDSNTSKLILNAREDSNDVQEHQRDSKSGIHYNTNLTGAYKEWQSEILDREGARDAQRRQSRESNS